ncbi:porin [Variovorax terrae]|uniref:Porin n=1 Tax=Variovorax terrae TaxID=2923278 RepID=A0A9X1VYL8_9BURK|nr:porin [Variovorax terrae]MCJ0765760.1 porin [Variovorax terrae]
MKKTLLTTLGLACAAAAHAQSSVTLFGVIDTGVQYGSGSVSKRTAVQGVGGNLATRLGFRGTEDLGGGLAASFWLEAGLNSDDGTGAASSANNQAVGAFNPATGANPAVRSGTQGLTFNRRSTVSLSGGFGEIRVGRDFTPSFWNHAFDPFTLLGVGAALEYTAGLRVNGPTDGTLARASNSVGYFLPDNLGGFYGQAMYALGENASNSANAGDGRYVGFRVGHRQGPWNVAFASGKTSQTIKATAGGSYTDTSIAGSYDFGVARAIAIYDLQKQQQASGAGSADRASRGWMMAVTVPVGVGLVKVSYGVSKKTDASVASVDGNKASQLALGYVHNLSQRTALYATWAQVRNSGGSSFAVGGGVTGANQSASGIDLGIRHSF